MLYIEEHEIPLVKKALFRSAMLVSLANDYSYHRKDIVEEVLTHIDSRYEEFLKEQENERIKKDVEVF